MVWESVLNVCPLWCLVFHPSPFWGAERGERKGGEMGVGGGGGTAYLGLQIKVKGKEGRGMSALSIGSPG